MKNAPMCNDSSPLWPFIQNNQNIKPSKIRQRPYLFYLAAEDAKREAAVKDIQKLKDQEKAQLMGSLHSGNNSS